MCLTLLVLEPYEFWGFLFATTWKQAVEPLGMSERKRKKQVQ
jgi:hypothetical protein